MNKVKCLKNGFLFKYILYQYFLENFLLKCFISKPGGIIFRTCKKPIKKRLFFKTVESLDVKETTFFPKRITND